MPLLTRRIDRIAPPLTSRPRRLPLAASLGLLALGASPAAAQYGYNQPLPGTYNTVAQFDAIAADYGFVTTTVDFSTLPDGPYLGYFSGTIENGLLYGAANDGPFAGGGVQFDGLFAEFDYIDYARGGAPLPGETGTFELGLKDGYSIDDSYLYYNDFQLEGITKFAIAYGPITTDIPEPAPVWLLLAGLPAAWAAARRRKVTPRLPGDGVPRLVPPGTAAIVRAAGRGTLGREGEMGGTYDVIVVGLGGMGSAAAYHLAGRGARTLGLDRFSPPHAHGSSHGDTRLTRQAVGEGDAYTPLALRSNELWRELERETGEELYAAVGGLILGDPHQTEALHGRADFLTQTLAAARKYGVAHEVLTAAEVRRRFPPFRVGPDDVGYYEPGAGYLRPERCVAAHLRRARERGADIHTGERVLDYAPTPGGTGVRVRTDRGEYGAGRLIVTAGPWASELLGDALRPLLTVYRQVQCWFDVEAPALFAPGRFPVFIRADGADSVYGFPAVDGPAGGVKVAGEDYLAPTTPDAVGRAVTDAEIEALYARRVRPALDGVGPRCLRAVTCLYTVTPDSHFVIDVRPDFPAVLVASPCSGHGFKHAAALGESLAEWATAGASRLDLSPFSLARFAPAGAA